jgi:hypothetical protein
VDPKRVISDPVGLISDLVAEADPGLDPGRARTVVVSTVGGRAKSRRIAAALVARPAVLADGRSPAPRAIGDLLLALRKAGATAIAAPCCADCGKQLRTLMRRGQHWYCSVCEQNTAACAGCGNLKQVRSHDRDGHPRCAQCPDPDDRDPIAVIHAAVAALDPADLLPLQFSRQKAGYVVATARLVASGRLDLAALAAMSATRAERTLLAVRGLGPWSVNYLMMRALGFPDCVPLGDTGVTGGLRSLFKLEERPDLDATRRLMSVFSPYRSLATAHLWQLNQPIPT